MKWQMIYEGEIMEKTSKLEQIIRAKVLIAQLENNKFKKSKKWSKSGKSNIITYS